MKRRSIKAGARILFIPIDDIQSNPFQPRSYYDVDSLNELSASICELGIIQPLSICDNKDGTYQLISGARRLRAAKMAGLERVPCIIFANERRKALLMSVTENIQRNDLNYFEEASVIDKLCSSLCFTKEEISQLLGKSEIYLMNKTRLLAISPEMRKKILENGLTERHTRVLLRLSNEEDREKLLKDVISQRLTVSQTISRSQEIISQKEKRNEPIKLFKDINVFVNTIDRAVDTMVKSGIEAQLLKNEDDKCIEYSIYIPKIG